jgi:uncharacterized protein YciI
MPDRAQYIYVMHALDPAKAASRDSWTKEDQETFNLHWTRLERARDEGRLILAGRSQDGDGRGPAIVIFEAESDDDAQRFFEEEPFFVQGFAQGTLHPFRVAVSRTDL